MKTLNLFGLVLALIGNTTNINAQSTGKLTASAKIVRSIGIKKIKDMDFGELEFNTIRQAVVITPAGKLTTISGHKFPESDAVVTAAVFSISGEATSKYDITLPTSWVVITSGGKSMRATQFTYDVACRTGLLPESGTQIINVGATLVLNESQKYDANAPFNLTVNYN